MIILFCQEGSIDLRLSLKKYHMTKNDILINTPGQIGEFNGMNEDVRFAVIAFSTDFYYPAYKMNAINSATQQKFLLAHLYCHFSESEMAENLAVYEFIKDKIIKNDTPCCEETIKGYLQAIVFNVYSKIISEKKKDQANWISRQQEIYNRFMELVQKHHACEHNIKFYADRLCITPKYLSRVVYKVTSRYAGEFIRDFVIFEAKMLIRSRIYSIRQISEMLHFTSQSFFGRYFKQATGYKNKS